ncbi:hypothetical protein WN55_07192, partial [Dufourea novaeangliae]
DLVQVIKPIYTDLSQDNLLERCLGGNTQNNNESFNGLLWHFAPKFLPHLLENIPLHIRQTMWFQQDGCPAHSARIITQFLNVTFEDHWICRAGNHKWPARSPDLTPLDFYLWGKLKQHI